MKAANYVEHFEKLLAKLPILQDLATQLESPNVEDDRCSRMAIVGFSYHSETSEWGVTHLEFLRARQRDGFPLIEGTQNGAEFCCLCIGYLLGLFQSSKIDDEGFGVAEAQLTGFIALHRGVL